MDFSPLPPEEFSQLFRYWSEVGDGRVASGVASSASGVASSASGVPFQFRIDDPNPVTTMESECIICYISLSRLLVL